MSLSFMKGATYEIYQTQLVSFFTGIPYRDA